MTLILVTIQPAASDYLLLYFKEIKLLWNSGTSLKTFSLCLNPCYFQ
jgi:hypothetical protein